MKRAILLASALALSASPAFSQARDGRVNQAVSDTLGAAMTRQGKTEAEQRTILDAVGNYLKTTFVNDTSCPHNAANRTWLTLMVCMKFVLPIDIGKDGEPYSGPGGFGGGGASGGIPEQAGRDCGDVDYALDPQGNLIIPSYSLDIGMPVTVGTETAGSGGTYWYANTGTLPNLHTVTGSTFEAAARRQAHLANMVRPRNDWFGIVNVGNVSGSLCVDLATVAYRNTANAVINRATTRFCGTFPPLTHDLNPSFMPAEASGPHKSCPDIQNVGSSEFHFYGKHVSSHWHDCTWFIPDTSLGQDGYAINEKTTVTFAAIAKWPEGLPGFIGQCGIDPELVRKIADELRKTIGSPIGPVLPEDSRPGDTKARDLADDPSQTTGQPNPQPNPDPTTPAPPPTTPPATGGPDFTNPNIPAPTLEEPPTGIMDPIFDWLPDLPSIELNVQGQPCPTWEMAPFDWELVIDSHCAVIEQNASLISAIMLVGFAVGAGLIILRA